MNYASFIFEIFKHHLNLFSQEAYFSVKIFIFSDPFSLKIVNIDKNTLNLNNYEKVFS